MLHAVAATAVLHILLMVQPLSAQDPRTGCAAVPGSHFRSTADSIACLDSFDRLDSMVSQLALDMSSSSIDSYISACDSVLQRCTEALTDTLHPLYAEALAYAGEAHWLKNTMISTRKLERAIGIMRRLPKPCEGSWSGRMLGNLAYQYYELGQLAEAEALYDEGIRILTSLPQPPAQLTASQYLFLGLLHRRTLHHDKSAVAFAESASWQLAAGDSASAAEAVGWHADALYHIQDLDGAEAAYLRACEILRSSAGGQAEKTLSAMYDLSTFYVFVARFNDSHRILSDVLTAITRPGAAYDPVLVFYTHLSLAMVCDDLGNDAEADYYFREASRCADMIPEADRPMFKAMVTNNTASYLGNRGRYAEAAALVEDAIRMMDQSGWDKVEQFKARAASNLATMYSELHRYAEAESLLVIAIDMYEQVFGSDSPELATPLSNQGIIDRDLGRFDEALANISRALHLCEQFYGNRHPLYARLLRNLGSVELAMGRDSAAIITLKRAEEALRQWYEPWHVELLDCLQLIGQWFERHPDEPEAEYLMRQLAEGTTRRLRDSFDFESESRQLQLYERFSAKNLGIIARWAMGSKSREAPAILFDAMMQLKGEVLAEHVRVHRNLQGRQMEADLSQSLYDARERYASLATKPPNDDVVALRRRLLLQIDSLDAALRTFSGGYERMRRINEADWRDVRRLLRRDEVLIAYLVVPPGRDDSAATLIALLVQADAGPALVSLCGEKQLERALAVPMDDRLVSLLPTDERMRKLAALIWDPLLPNIPGKNRAVIVPDGVLHRVAFAALIPEGETPAGTVLDERMELRHHVSLKGLLARNPAYQVQREVRGSGCVLIGNPDFGAAASGRREARSAMWKPLPGTKRELERIAEVCGSNGVDVRNLGGREASEQTLKSLSASGLRILHIATHGYFFPAPRDSSAYPSISLEHSRGREYFRIEQHPLLRSGLILAGANAAWSGNPVGESDEDGILTALEISRLDFSGAELVVLSACETALGDITTGEGVLGLQRSFFISGASSLLMSLWKVPDDPTVELMASFYSAWLSGMNKTEALRSARSELRKKYPDPQVWAPFVLVGE